MPKPLLQEPRFDFRGGRNTNVSPDLLNATELVDATNARIGHDILGAVTKRTGTRRLHQTALGAPSSINGVFQWDAPSGKQVIAVSNGNFYFRNAAGADFGAFTLVAAAFPTSGNAHFTTFRDNTSGAPLVVFIALGGVFYKWDGTTLTRLDPIASGPATLWLIKAYHTRLFTVDLTNYLQTIWWSKVGTGGTWATGLSTDGGSAMVDVLSGDQIQAIETVGTSLLIATKNAVARFTGYSSNDIQIAQDTAGLSSDVGVVGDNAFLRVEQVVALFSDRGAYVASEAGVQSIGFDVEPDFDAADRSNFSKITIGHNRQRREVWFAYPAVGDGGVNKHVLVYNYRIQNWYGPFVYPFAITSLYPYVDSTGQEWFMAGCTDGFIRHLDIGATDDVLFDGTGGSAYTMTVDLAPYLFGAGPGIVKALRRLFVQAELTNTTALTISAAADTGGFISLGTLVGVSGTTVQNYRVDSPSTVTGHRIRIRMTDASSDIPVVNGLIVEAFDMLRPA